MYRWGLSNGKNVIQTEKDAKRLFPQELWNKLHLQIIWYGREYSQARGWDLEKDIITKTVGRKSVLDSYHKKRPAKAGLFAFKKLKGWSDILGTGPAT